jgi:hypothetical protein
MGFEHPLLSISLLLPFPLNIPSQSAYALESKLIAHTSYIDRNGTVFFFLINLMPIAHNTAECNIVKCPQLYSAC